MLLPVAFEPLQGRGIIDALFFYSHTYSHKAWLQTSIKYGLSLPHTLGELRLREHGLRLREHLLRWVEHQLKLEKHQLRLGSTN